MITEFKINYKYIKTFKSVVALNIHFRSAKATELYFELLCTLVYSYVL